ncbi:hypothetical protein VTO42DRAFT_7451 [Malbranchea cinnamomea]
MATVAVDLPFIASHYAIPETTLTTLTQEPTVHLVKQLLECIARKARETEELKSDKLRLEVELENAVRSGETKVKALKASAEKARAEISSLRTKLQDAEGARSSLESELDSLKSTSSTSEAEFSSLKSRIASLEASNRDTLGLLESKSTAYDKLADELSSQHKKTLDLRKEVAELEQKLQAANSTAASTRFREQSLQQELELAKKNNEWFETELKTKSEEYLKYRKEKGARISELQRLNDEANSSIETLKRNENALKSRLDEIEQKYEDCLTTIQQLKEEAIQAQESFRIELDSAGRLAELQQNAAETAKRRVQECQVALERAKDDAAEQISRLRAELETEHSDKEAAERRIAELEMRIGELESEVSAARIQPMSPGPNGGPSTPIRPGTPVGTFSPRSVRTKGGLTLTQMYTEYDKMRTRLIAEQKENQELKAAMDEMVQDLESTKPEIDELRSENSRLEAAIVDMSDILDTAGKERDEATREARKWQGKVEGLEREGQILRQQLRDLSAQVKVLVMEVHLLSAGEKEYDRAELEKIARGELDDSSEDLSSTGRFISRHMTTFKNLSELQEQNVTLRGMLRELGEKMEGEEARRKNASYEKDMEELKELRVRCQTYRDEMANLVAQSKSYIKERDTFRSMLMRRRQGGESAIDFSQSLPLGAAPPTFNASTRSQPTDAPDYAELLRKLQAHFDTFREETATDHSALKQQVNDLTRKNSELQSEVSRSNSQLTASVQRAELLQSNINLLKNENTELQKRYSILLENANRQDLKTQQVAEELVEAKNLVDSLRRETANLKAEKDLWKGIEKRLIEDNESLRNDRSRLDSLNANLQSMLNEREHTDAETRRRLQSNIESLESELQATKRKLVEESEEAKKITLRREFEHEQSRKRIDDLVTTLSSVREELVSTKTTRDHLQARVDELTVELKSAEERLAVVQRKPGTTAAAGIQEQVSEPAQEGELTREQELAVEVSELKRDLELAKSELEHAKNQVDDYKAISQSTEERLQELTDTNEQYRQDTDRILEEKNVRISELENRVEQLSSELSAAKDDLSRLREEQENAQQRYDEQKSVLEAEISRLKEQEERYIAATQFHQQDLKAQAEIAQRAQQNYESELVKHAEAAKNLQTVRAEANHLRLEVVDLRSQAEAAKNSLAQHEEIWNEIKGRYEGEIEELNRRREEVLKQNSLLHDQLENITRQISALQRDRTGIPEHEEETATGSDLEGLQEVIKFLRREKEIVDVQYHLSTQESKRLRQQLDYTQTQLEETRLKLEQQRRAEADSEHNALNHKKLMDTLNELNLFRESSVTLRNQVKQAEAAVAEKSARIDELQQEIEPLKTRIRELENVVETKDGEMKLLQEDRDRWQQRTQNILQKYDRVDPAEMEALKEKLASLEKERDEAISSVEKLKAENQAFPEQLKQAEERVQELRAKLTEQFKARSKELTGRINAKQTELNSVVQEKEAIQAELNRTREELEALKSKAPEPTPTTAPATAPTPAVSESAQNEGEPPAASGEAKTAGTTHDASAAKIKSLEEKIASLEAALAQKDAEVETKVKEKVDRMKEILNNKLAEYKALHRDEIEKLKAAHQQELAARTEGGTIPELNDAQARDLVSKNETIKTIIRNNIRSAVAKERERATQVANEEKETLLKEREQKINSAVELAEKRLLAKVSMTEGRARNAQAKLDVVQKAATDTPQKPVVEVWEIAKTARPPPIAPPQPKSSQPEAPAPSPAPAAGKPSESAPTVTEGAQQQPSATPAQQVVPSPQAQVSPGQLTDQIATQSTPQQQAPPPAQQAQQPSQPPSGQQVQQPVQPQPQPQAQQQAQQQPQQQPQQTQSQNLPAGLPNRPQLPTQHIGTGPGALRALQSGLPVARGGRGRGAQPGHQQQQHAFGSQSTEQQSQSHVGRGSGLPRGGRGRGGQGRGGGQNVQTGNVPQGHGQPASPRGGRGGLNAQARQFIPQGAKRAREDGSDAGDGGSGKRIRGGGMGS